MNNELGRQEAKAIGTGTDTNPVFTTTSPSKRRLRWKLLIGALVLMLAGYGLADAAHSFGWWPPVINNAETTATEPDWFGRLHASNAVCEGALDVIDEIVNHDRELATRVGLILDGEAGALVELERLAAQRVAVIEALLQANTVKDRLCENTVWAESAWLFRASHEEALASLRDSCLGLGWDC